jgi:hypothetical protein
MALSSKAKKRIEVALARRAEANEVIAAIESGANPQAASVPVLGTLAAVGAVDVADVGPANVALSADVDARIASLQAKIDAIISALKAAGLMA